MQQRSLALASSLRLLWRAAAGAGGAITATATGGGAAASASAAGAAGRWGVARPSSSSPWIQEGTALRHSWASLACASAPATAAGAAAAATATAAAAAAARASTPLPTPTPTHAQRRRFSSAPADAAPSSSHPPKQGTSAAPDEQPPSSDAQQQGITLADSAVARLLELRRRAGGRPLALRVEVEGGGCSGFQYVLRLEEGAAADPSPGDSVFEREGARVLVDEVSLGLLKGSVIEFEDTLMRSAFHVASNPNSEASCGCGSSFAAKGL